MADLPFLAVKDFAKHQHYRDRRPPWIKLYASVLTDAAFLQMPEAAQAQLMKLWILASQFGNPLPNNSKLLAGKIGCLGRFYLKELIASGFLIPCEQIASETLAGVERPASTPVRVAGEVEKEIEIEQSTTPEDEPKIRRIATPGEDRLALKLVSDADRLALTAICAKVPSPVTWVAEMDARLEGMHLPMLTPEQLGAAIREYVGNGALDRPNFRHFCGYLTNTRTPRPPAESVNSALDQWAKDSDAKERKNA